MNVAKVTPTFKKVEKCSIWNFREISVFPSFSKIVQQTIYNRLWDYLTADILFNKQFEFRAGHLNEHGFLELIDHICDSLNDKISF